MMKFNPRLLSALRFAGGAVIGLYLSYSLNLAAGGLIVIVLTAVFLIAYGASPKHGLIATLRRSPPHARTIK